MILRLIRNQTIYAKGDLLLIWPLDVLNFGLTASVKHIFYLSEHTYNLILKSSYNPYNLTPYTTAFLTGQGPFMTHLKKRKIKSSVIF